MKLQLIVGAGAAILKEDAEDKRILLTKRVFQKENFPEHWTFPAGRIELVDSSLEETAKREIKEEVNLDFEIKEKLGFYESQRYSKRFISLLFLGSFKGKVKVQESEISEAGWFTYDEARELPLAFAYPEVIEDLHSLGLL